MEDEDVTIWGCKERRAVMLELSHLGLAVQALVCDTGAGLQGQAPIRELTT